MALTTVNPGLLDSQAQYTGFKNRIINGSMMIDQRNAGASVTLTNTVLYTVDRWSGFEDTDGGATAQQVTDAPTGFNNSLKITITSQDSSLGATQRLIVQHRIEGYNIADLGFGSANAKTITLSFWVKSSLTGTFGGGFTNASDNRGYAFTYTISAANTWEYKSVTIAGDTTGTWGTTNGNGITITFGLGVGSTYSATSGSWVAQDVNSATGAVSVIGTNGATWQITGVQLEKGSTATSFDYRPYGTELALCQRYFQLYTVCQQEWIYNEANGSTNKWWQFYIPFTMRTAPSVSLAAISTGGSIIGAGVTVSSLAVVGVTLNRCSVRVNASGAGGTANSLYHTDSFNNQNAQLSAEL